MSSWTYINGVITVFPLGRTQAEKRYILDTVLDHLPKVTGSERDMNTYLIQKSGYNSSCSHDEFGQYSNLGNEYRWNSGHPSFGTQDEYMIVVDASLRDREFEETLKEFNNWLCRLAKRVEIEDILVKVKGYEKEHIFKEREPYEKMFENPSWCNKTGEPTWCEFMLYDRAKNSDYPMLLDYKYFADEENDKEVERRMEYEK